MKRSSVSELFSYFAFFWLGRGIGAWLSIWIMAKERAALLSIDFAICELVAAACYAIHIYLKDNPRPNATD